MTDLSANLSPPLLRLWRAIEARPVWAVTLLGLFIFVPALGSVGLWDPWETHYAEVAREMIARQDFVYPHWGSAYFFSKPVLTLWMIAAGLLLVGAETGGPELPLPAGVEWGVRLPFALLAILLLLAVWRLGRTLGGPRAGLASAFILATSPLMVFVGKQAMTDLPVVACIFIGLALTVPSAFGDRAEIGARPARLAALLFVLVGGSQLVLMARAGPLPWVSALLGLLALLTVLVAVRIARSRDRATVELALAGLAFGFGALAKGLAVAALVGPTFLIAAAISRDLGPIRRARPGWVILCALLIALPWYLVLSTFSGRDEEGLSFLGRFLMHDHLARVFSGVHGDRGGAGYYAEQLLYGFFPWVCFLPLALLGVGTTRPRERQGAWIFMMSFAAFSYVFFTASATKLHHYIFPALPALALVVGCWAAGLRHRALGPGAAVVALVIFAVGLHDLVDAPATLVHLFTYKYDRSFPRGLIVAPALLLILGGGAALAIAAGVLRRPALSTLAIGLSALGLASYCSHYHFNMLSPHYSQAQLFRTYFEERRAGEPILAYQLNWRGEAFYSRGQVVELMNAGAADRLRAKVGEPGRHFILIENTRFTELRNLLPAPARERLEIIDRSNEHFYLCQVDTP